jgi:hypothetical protein
MSGAIPLLPIHGFMPWVDTDVLLLVFQTPESVDTVLVALWHAALRPGVS